MSSDEFERRINNSLAAIVENQARFDENMAKMQEAIAGLIQVARIQDERLDRITQQTEENSKQIKENSGQIAALTQQGKEQAERIDALIRIVDGHISNHP